VLRSVIKEYHEKRDAIQDQILVVQQDLSNLEDVNTGMTRIAFLRHLLMSMTRGWTTRTLHTLELPGETINVILL
jgi:hypothetical protein